MAVGIKGRRAIFNIVSVLLLLNILLTMELPISLITSYHASPKTSMYLTASAFSVGRFGWPGLEWREIIDWWTSGYSRGVVIGRNYIPPCKLCDMPRMFRVDK